jgi:hypothetical protein
MKNEPLKANNPVAQEIFNDPYKMRYYNLFQIIKNFIRKLKNERSKL